MWFCLRLKPWNTTVPESKGTGTQWKPTSFPASLFFRKSRKPNGLNQTKIQPIFLQATIEGVKKSRKRPAVLLSPSCSLSALYILVLTSNLKPVRGKNQHATAFTKPVKSWRPWTHTMARADVISGLSRGNENLQVRRWIGQDFFGGC